MIKIRSFRDIFRLFYIYKQEFKWAFLTTLAVAILGAFLLPSRFESGARLLVKPGRETSTIPIQYGDRQALVSPSTQRDPIIDEELQLTGRPIIREVGEFYLKENIATTPQGVWKTLKFNVKRALNSVAEFIRSLFIAVGLTEEKSAEERLVKKLQKQFTATHAPGSSVIEVSLVWDDPAIAQKVLSKWIATYLEERTRILGHKSLYQFYETESKRIAAQIANNKRKISQYLMTIDGTSSKDRLVSLTGRLNKLSDQRAEAYADLLAREEGVYSAKRQIRNLPREVTSERELSLNPARQDMLLKLNELEVQRLDKLKIFQNDAPPIQELDVSIAALTAHIAKERDTVQRSENRMPNELVTSLKRNELEGSIKINEIKARLAENDRELRTLKKERELLLKIDPELSRLERDLVIAEKSYASYLDNLEKAYIDHALDSSRISNIAIIEPATFKPDRVFPKSIPILLAALPASLAVALFVLYLCYLMDQRIHDGDRVEDVFGVPLWTTVMDLRNGEKPPAFEASIYRLYSLLPLDRIEQSGLNIGITSSTRGEGVSFIIEHFLRVLHDRGISARIAADTKERVLPGEVLLIHAPNLLSHHDALIQLKNADLRLLVVEARKLTVPVVENALSILTAAFKKMDGIIVNKRRFEIPLPVLQRLALWKGTT